MEGKPDLIIGNYTDGNLVASLMASKLGITLVSLYFLLIHLFNKAINFKNKSAFVNTEKT